MRLWRWVLAGILLVAFALSNRQVWSHGSMEFPVSRVYACFLEGPENPVSPACQYAVSVGGTQPLYDWNEVNIPNADGRHRDLIPDGKLCSAGNPKYAAFDEPRTDWPVTAIQSGLNTFRFRATAPHRGYFELYITKPGYDPSQPLRWSDLEQFAVVTDPPLQSGSYVFNVTVPARQGRHVIYAIWQRTDSPEAFYSCSDVIVGSSTTPVPTLTPTPTATLPPGQCTAPAWDPNAIYVGGDVVSHNGHLWRAKWWTQGEEPGTTGPWGVWEDLGPCGGTGPTPTPQPTATPRPTTTPSPSPTPTPPGGIAAWQPYTSYAVGDRVTYGGLVYRCLQAHTSLPGWEPPNVPALWAQE